MPKAMQDEIELKFEVTKESLATLKSSRWFSGARSGTVASKKLVSVYFDTDKFKLRREGLSLRVRHAGDRRIQTIKADGNSTAGLFCRQEWETEISTDTPDFKAARGTALQPLLTKKVRRGLKPLFETRVQRTMVPVDTQDSRIELTLDEGRVRTGKKSAPIAEIELELKKGNRKALLDLAQQLAEVAPASLAVRSKSDRGYALVEDNGVAASHATPIKLDPENSSEQAFRAVGHSCLRHLASNEAAVRNAQSDGVHQMRVGLRRLRAAISIFSELLRHPQTEAIKAELKWLTSQLGPARDLDVFVSESVAPVHRRRPRKQGMEALHTDLETRRAEAFRRAKEAVESPRYRTLVLSTLIWLESGDWAKGGGKLARARRERPIQPFAEEILSVRLKKVLKRARRLQELDAHQRHKLRIAVKKLRYATEFFAGLFPGRKKKKLYATFRQRLESLQSCLGKLNDIAVHEKLATEIVLSDAPPKPHGKKRERAFAVGLVSGHEQSRGEPALAIAAKASVRLARLQPFWK